MNTLDVAKDLYEQEAERTRGLNSQKLADNLRETADNIRGIVQRTREAEEVADALEESGQVIEQTFAARGLKNVAQDEGTGGKAQLGTPGSQEGDARKVMSVQSVVDPELAEGLAAHEQHHVLSKKPDASQVTLANRKEIDVHRFEEAGAIAAQRKAAPGSVQHLSEEYRRIDQDVGSLLPQHEIIELTLRGQMKEFARKVNRKIAA